MRGFALSCVFLASLCVPASGAKETVDGKLTRPGDVEIIAAFGERVSGLCKMRMGTITLESDGTALVEVEIVSPDPSSRWRGQFILIDKDQKTLSTIPAAGGFTIEIKEIQPRSVAVVMPITYDATLLKSVSAVKMEMECD